MYDCIPPTEDFDCLRPDGSIIVSIDRRYNVSMFKSRFDGWYESSVHLWPKYIEQNGCVLSFDNPLAIESSSNVSDDSGCDTGHWFLVANWLIFQFEECSLFTVTEILLLQRACVVILEQIISVL